jgi:hypothetical protein
VQQAMVTLPSRRTAFSTGTVTLDSRRVTNAAADLFSLTIGKPAPGEVPGVKWNNPPSSVFLASGFTIARVMISTPGVSILNIPADGISISKFEDDKGKHEPSYYRDARSSGYQAYFAPTSPDGQQTLVTISMTSAPSPGATRIALAGTIRANAARGDHVDESKAFSAKKNESIKVGPYTFQVIEMHAAPVMSPATMVYQPPYGAAYEMILSAQGAADRIRSIDVLDAQTRQVIGQYRNLMRETNGSSQNFFFGMREPAGDQLMLRVSYYDKAEVVEIPFDINTGIGL